MTAMKVMTAVTIYRELGKWVNMGVRRSRTFEVE